MSIAEDMLTFIVGLPANWCPGDETDPFKRMALVCSTEASIVTRAQNLVKLRNKDHRDDEDIVKYGADLM